MIKDVMVRLDGTAADELRLAAADHVAELFESQIIGLFLNVLPMIIPADGGSAGALLSAQLIQQAKETGDRLEAELAKRFARLQKPVEIRRIDVFGEIAGEIAAREARSTDTFVALRPNGAPKDPEHMVESVLFGSGRHLLLVPDRKQQKSTFDNVLVAWNGSRKSARALAEAMPYLQKSDAVTVVVVTSSDAEEKAVLGKDAVNHLRHHGIKAALRHARKRDDVADTLIAEARRLKADLIVMGGYGHSRLREWLLGGATYELMHRSPVPLLIAH